MKKTKVLLSFFVYIILLLGTSGLLLAKEIDAVEVFEKNILEDVPLESSENIVPSIDFNVRNFYFDKDYDKHFANFRAVGIEAITLAVPELSKTNIITLKEKPNLDCLDEIMEAATRQKIKVWINFNWNLEFSKNRDKAANLMSQKYIEGQYLLIDAIAEKKQKYPNILGTYWDEIWCAEIYHLYPGYVSSFREFCKKEYNEEYVGQKMPTKPDPNNKWWRRFVVFKNCIYENFSQKLYDYSKKKGLQVMNRTVPSQSYGENAWKWGLDPYRIGKIGDCVNLFCSRSYEGNFNENSVIVGYKDLRPLDFAWVLRGYPLSYFTYSRYFHGKKVRDSYNELVKQSREWIGAERLAEVAILNYPINLIGSFKNPTLIFRDNELLLTNRLSRYFETDRIDIRDTRFYKKYKILVVPKYSGNSIPEFAYRELLKYVEDGGILVVLDAEFSVGKRDLTNPSPVSKELCGIETGKGKQFIGSVKFNNKIMQGALIPGDNKLQKGIALSNTDKVKVLATSNNKPVITEYSLGEGKVIYVNLDLAKRIKEDNKWLRILAGLINSYHIPAITSNGAINVESVIRKNERLLISLYPASEGEVYLGEVKPTDQPGDIPSVEKQTGENRGIIRIDTKSLGLNDNKYQVFRLSEYKLLPKSKNELYWTKDDLKKGIPVNITEEAGYENIVIEKPGTAHKGESILSELKKVDDQQKEDIRQGKLHPLGLRKDPFKSRVEISKSASPSSLKWEGVLPYRISVSIDNSLNTERKGEPIIISGAELLNATGNKRIYKSSIRIYEIDKGTQTEIASQVNSSRGKDKGLEKEDEVVFVSMLKPGQTDFLIYYSDKETKTTNYSGIKVTAGKGKGENPLEIINTGVNKIKLDFDGQMQIHDEVTGLPVVELRGVGDRYAGWSHRGNVKGKWVIKGPVHWRFVLNTKAKRDTFHNVYDFYYGSPYIRISYSSDEKAIVNEMFYWPVGTLLGKASTASILTDGGWLNTAQHTEWHNIQPFRDKVKTVVKQGDLETQFGFLLAHSNIVIPPHLLVSKSKNKGYFIVEFSEYHCSYTPVDNPEVEFVYVHNAGNEKQIDSYAQRLKQPLIIKLGKKQESKPE